jgi:hypothetical protein
LPNVKFDSINPDSQPEVELEVRTVRLQVEIILNAMWQKNNGAPRVKIKTKIKERVTPHPLQ